MFKNRDSASPNLRQGTEFVINQDNYNKNIDSIIENTDSPDLGSIVEGMSSMANYESSLDNLTDLAQVNQDELSSSVAVQEYKKEYATAWKNYSTQTSKLDKNMNTMFSNINDNLDISEKLNTDLNEQEQQKSDHTSSFQQNTVGVDKLNARMLTVSAEEDDSTMVVKSSGIHYLVYIILLITIFSHHASCNYSK